jgi:hypothetical protein
LGSIRPEKLAEDLLKKNGISYDSDKTDAQMMRPETLKTRLIIALYRGWAIRQWDIVPAYLQAPLHHNVYISDINENGEIEYWKLNKALYGLKQAGHGWFKMLQRIFSKEGLYQCTGDERTYTNKKGSLIIGTHVDDLLGIAHTDEELNKVEEGTEKQVESEKRERP